MQANTTFKIVSWDENAYAERESGAKLTKASVRQAYEGDLVGEGSVEFLMSHSSEGSAHFVGLELVTGVLAGKQGTFVLQHAGTYGSSGARSEWFIVPGSGTGELAGIAGKGVYAAASEAVDMPFTYEIENGA
jgi:hypothetical protein